MSRAEFWIYAATFVVSFVVSSALTLFLFARITAWSQKRKAMKMMSRLGPQDCPTEGCDLFVDHEGPHWGAER